MAFTTDHVTAQTSLSFLDSSCAFVPMRPTSEPKLLGNRTRTACAYYLISTYYLKLSTYYLNLEMRNYLIGDALEDIKATQEFSLPPKHSKVVSLMKRHIVPE